MPPNHQQLPKDERKRRIHAARVLRGLRSVDLQRLLTDEGLGKTDAGRTERGELPLTPVRLRTLVDILRMPERWFTEESVDAIVGFSRPGEDESAREEALRRLREAGFRSTNPDDHEADSDSSTDS